MRKAMIVATLCLVSVGGAEAQQSDRIGTQLDWGPARIGLFPTPMLGMQLMVSTNVEAVFQPLHGMSGGFDPDSVLDWLNYADKVLHPIGRPSAPEAALLTPVLRSWSGDSIRVMRRAKGRKWDPRLVVMVDSPGPHPDRFDLLVLPEQAADLLAGLQREAMLSGFNADTVRAIADRPPTAVEVEPDDPPVLLEAGPTLYPPGRRVRARVVMQFVVDTTGHPDPRSIHAILADHATFVEAATAVVAGSRYTPAHLRGAPVAVMVRQVINFAP